MRIFTFFVSSGLLVISASAFAGSAADVNAEEFYVTARQLEKKGMLAMFDDRAKAMQAQMKDAGLSARAANAAATKRGSPLYCVSDAQRKKGLGVQQVLDMLGGLGQPARSRLTLEAAWLAALKRSYPCD